MKNYVSNLSIQVVGEVIMFLFITADRIGIETGGGVVTKNELRALQELGEVKVLNPNPTADPFDCEKNIEEEDWSKYKLAHFYSGSYPELAEKLKKAGVKITYTAAAHDVKTSKEEWEKNRFAYDFPHLTNPDLLKKYLSCYQAADVVICPSTHSKQVMHNFNCKNVELVPHGCDPMEVKDHPATFTVGYLGQTGPDKGVIYLMEAWAKLDYKDAVLNIAGRTSTNVIGAAREFGKGNVNVLGFVKSINKFYNSCSVYVQPSVTEGFGIEVLEAINCHRPVIVSDGAGAADCVGECGIVFEKRNVKQLAAAINKLKNDHDLFVQMANNCHLQAQKYTWEKIRRQYQNVWKGLLA